ncbi:MAG TPA: GNAT family N-acetyltransferase [Solirubrobacteraceae bacterium]|nr:GNAT family N-acetyltransferase [Solirubrobacteraceae bacterium]
MSVGGAALRTWAAVLHADPIVFDVVSPAGAADPDLREQLLDTWVRVTDAGGAVGFTAPADRDQIAAMLDSALRRVARGQDALGVLRRGAGGSDSPAVGMGILVASAAPLRRHWRTVLRVMVAPELQGLGAGRTLLEGLHDHARALGAEHLILAVRGGTGYERFYERFGYEIVGRHPAAIRVAPGDDRDELTLFKRL